MQTLNQENQQDIQTQENNLYSNNARLIKQALDFYLSHPDLAIPHIARVEQLKEFSSAQAGLGAVQVEVAAIVVWHNIRAKQH